MSVGEMRRLVEGAYYSALQDSPTMDFSFARRASLNEQLKADLDTLRTRIRYEMRQNGHAKGMPRIFANACVGTGPRLSIESADAGWAERAEDGFSLWAMRCGYLRGESLGMMLHQGVRNLFSCGEYVRVQRTADTICGTELRFLPIKPDRIRTPSGKESQNIMDGVETDADGKPTKLHILTAAKFGATLETTDVPVHQCVHFFYPEEEDQLRGEPWLATSLGVFHGIRRYDSATIAAAQVAAKFAAVLVNTNPEVAASIESILPSAVLDIQDGMMFVPPPGYEPKQITPQHPSTNASDFRRDQLGSSAAGFAMPVNIATGDSSRSNFASARYDGVSFEQEIAVVRSWIEAVDLNHTFGQWLWFELAQSRIGRPTAPYRLVWRWQKEQRHTDPYKAANANAVRLKSGEATLGRIYGENGQDREQAYKELLDEVTYFRSQGLAHPFDANLPEPEPQDDEDDKEEPRGEEE